MAERRIDDRLDHFGLRVGLADAFQAAVRPYANENRVLAAGSLVLDVGNAEELADDFGDSHGLQCIFARCRFQSSLGIRFARLNNNSPHFYWEDVP
jgi:hypothetical protein